jgi:RNA polymerase sigma factor (sigma-70 family)
MDREFALSPARHAVTGMREAMAQSDIPDAVARDLCRRAQAGDSAARGRLITGYLRAVERAALKFSSIWGIDSDELFCRGAEGLVRGVDLYDPEQACAVRTWLFYRIMFAIFKGSEYDPALRQMSGADLEQASLRAGPPDNSYSEELAELARLLEQAVREGRIEQYDAEALAHRALGSTVRETELAIGQTKSTVSRGARRAIVAVREILADER